MDVATSGPHDDADWRSLYVAALFEGDRGRLVERIKQAQGAIVARARQLFFEAGDHIQEEQALDNALYALEALRNCHSAHNTLVA